MSGIFYLFSVKKTTKSLDKKRFALRQASVFSLTNRLIWLYCFRSMRILISFTVMMLTKAFATVFYKLELKWISDIKNDFDRIRLIIFLNHTSLYEPLFIRALPTWFIFRLARKMVAPGADKTLNRAIVGFFWKILSPGMISITRKRDRSWTKFLEKIKKRSIIVIAPEGRMKRESGFDKDGKPMSVRSGVADIIEELNEGRIAIAYSGGLHHVQHPGEKIPRLFKTIKMNLEVLEIQDFKAQFTSEGIELKKEIVADLENRLKKNCPLND